MINQVVLVGRMTKDPELNYVGQKGTAMVSFTVAVNRTFKNKDGEYEADFIRCKAFNKTAEIIGQYGAKGMLVGVTGNIQTGSYTNDNGDKVFTTDVMCNQFQMLEKKNSNQQSENNKKSPDFNDDPFEKNDDPIDISNDDLPF